MKKLRLFDSLKLVVAVVAATFILNVAHADTTAIQSVIAYGKTEQSATPTPTAPVPIMTNNGVLKVNPNLWNGIITNFAYTGNPAMVSENTAYSGIVVEVVPGQTYTFARASAIGNRFVYFFTKEYPEVGMPAYGVVSGTSITSLKKTFTVPAEMKYVVFYFDITGTNIIESKMRLVQGTSADEVYVDGLTETIRDAAGHKATAQMLLSVGDYKDEQNITTGAITRRVGVRVFDGTENWSYGGAQNGYCRFVSKSIDDKKFGLLVLSNMFKSKTSSVVSNDEREALISGYGSTNNLYFSFPENLLSGDLSTNEKHIAAFKQWLAEQYAAGTPVIVLYPLATETTENVTAQSLTTAPVRQTLGAIMDMPIKTILTDNTEIMSGANELIKIATTKYNEESFEDVQGALTGVFNAVDTVVTQTMNQAQAIDTIATTKQTRPDEGCPQFKKCLLVEDEDGTPHWYEIYDPINDFLNPILAAAGLSGNQGAPTQTTHTENGSTLYDTSNIFYNGSGAFRKKYIDNTTSVADRPFGPTTLPRCADNATRTTSTVNAGICYNTGGMFRTLTEGADDDSGEWALVWNGAEGGASLGITPGVVYGVAKCTTVGQHTTQITGDEQSGSEYWWPKKLTAYSGGGTTLASLIEQYPNSNVEDAFNQLPNPYGTDDNPENPRANYRNCWCKMTAIGVPGSGDTPDQRYANGTIMSVGGGWVFNYADTSVTNCAYNCASVCARSVRAYAAFRKNVLTVK